MKEPKFNILPEKEKKIREAIDDMLPDEEHDKKEPILRKFASDLCFKWFNDINKSLKKDHNILMRYVLFVVFMVRLQFVRLVTKFV